MRAGQIRQKVVFGFSLKSSMNSMTDKLEASGRRYFEMIPPPINVFDGGMSLEDILSRSMTLFGNYIPYGVTSVATKQYPFETNIRNALTWLATLALIYLSKNSVYGYNALANKLLMVPRNNAMLRQVPAKLGEKLGLFARQPKMLFQYLVNRLRPDGNYLMLCHRAKLDLKQNLGVDDKDVTRLLATLKDKAITGAERAAAEAQLKTKLDGLTWRKAYWTNLKRNELKGLHIYRQQFFDPATNKVRAGLSQAEQQDLSLVNQIIAKMSGALALANLMGGVVMALGIGVGLQIVVRLISAPLDKHIMPKVEYKGHVFNRINNRAAATNNNNQAVVQPARLAMGGVRWT